MTRLLLCAMLLALAACTPFPIHEDCLGSGCGYSGIKTTSQNIAVSGADRRTLQDGRGRCRTYDTTIGFNNGSRHVRMFVLDLWLPATAPRYRIELRITGYRGPGQFSTADSGRFLYDPANGPTIAAEVDLVPSANAIATPTNAKATVDAGETSGSLQIDLPDRSFAGTWTCASVSVTKTG